MRRARCCSRPKRETMTETVFPPATGRPLFADMEGSAAPESESECVICTHCSAELVPWHPVAIQASAR